MYPVTNVTSKFRFNPSFVIGLSISLQSTGDGFEAYGQKDNRTQYAVLYYHHIIPCVLKTYIGTKKENTEVTTTIVNIVGAHN